MSHKNKSTSGRMSSRGAYKLLEISSSASVEEINAAYQAKLDSVQKRYADRSDKLVAECDKLYQAYRTVYLLKDPDGEDKMLPLTITGPDALLNVFGIQDVPHTSLKVQMQSQAKYKDGQLVRAESTKTESYINKDGKRETKVYENGKLIRHTIDDRDVNL